MCIIVRNCCFILARDAAVSICQLRFGTEQDINYHQFVDLASLRMQQDVNIEPLTKVRTHGRESLDTSSDLRPHGEVTTKVHQLARIQRSCYINELCCNTLHTLPCIQRPNSVIIIIIVR